MSQTISDIGVSIIVDPDLSKNVYEGYRCAVAKHLDMSSIPGACILRQLGTTNREVFQYDPETQTISQERFLLVYGTLVERINSLFDSVISDPIYTFIKPEPHKLTKIQEGRYRIISGVSLIDNLVDRILFQKLVEKIMENLGRHPIAVGWNPIVGSQTFYAVMGHHDQYLSLDKSHWDWSVHPWLIEAVKKVLKGLVPLAPSWWSFLVDQRFEALFGCPTWEFQDGSSIIQRQPGIMKSGCYMTIWINSIAQLLIHNYVSSLLFIPKTPIWVLGDDTIQVLDADLISPYLQQLRVLGFSVRFELTTIPEFCGFHIHRYYHVPSYIDKHSFLLRHLSRDPEIAESTLRSYQLLYCNDKKTLAKIREIVLRRNLPRALFSDDLMAMIQNQ